MWTVYSKEEIKMRINHNIAALNTYRQLNSASEAQSKSMEKLSSGLRINKAGDDAAGLAISEKMRGQIRGLDMASKNAQDATSMIQTAEGALNETHDILQRMRELSVQASNDTNTVDDREEIQKEINQMTSEINRIGNTTEFNTKKLLNGDLSSTSKVKAGTPTDTTVTKATTQTVKVGDNPVSWSGSDKTKFDVKFTGTADNGFKWNDVDEATASQTLSIGKTATGDFTVNITAKDGSASTLNVDADAVAFDSTKNVYTYNNHGVSFSFTKEQADAWKANDTVTIDLTKAAKDAGSTGDLTGAAINTDSGIQPITTQTGTADSTVSDIKVDGNSAQLLENVAKVDVAWDGTNATITLKDATGADISSSQFSLAAGKTLNYDANGIKFDFALGTGATGNFKGTFNLETKATTTTTNVGEVIEDKSATFQIGANENQSMSLSFSDMRAKALGITGSGDGFSGSANVTNGTNNDNVENALDVTSASNAAKAITTIDKAIKSVSQERSKLGATQNRLEHTINNLSTSSENLTAAESRIRDVDMAKEMMNQTKNSILSQAAQAMLAQANQQPQGVLQLLR